MTAWPSGRRSRELNPYHPGWFHFLPWLEAFTTEDYESALAAACRVNMHQSFWDPLLRAATLGKLGRTDEAALAYRELTTLHPSFVARPDHYVGCFVHADETRADVLDGLSVAGLG